MVKALEVVKKSADVICLLSPGTCPVIAALKNAELVAAGLKEAFGESLPDTELAEIMDPERTPEEEESTLPDAPDDEVKPILPPVVPVLDKLRRPRSNVLRGFQQHVVSRHGAPIGAGGRVINMAERLRHITSLKSFSPPPGEEGF